MATKAGLNKNSSAVKRIMSEARELRNDDSTDYSAGPLESDIFEWHCTIRGPADTEFEGGLYHCRILLPPEYPFKAPSLMVLTPNGRFELNKKICISFTSYHEELWQPAWGVRTAIIGLQGFFPLKGEAAIGVGAVEYPLAERKRLAALSRSWTCPDCGVPNLELLPDPVKKESSSAEPSEPATAAATPPTPSTPQPQPEDAPHKPTALEIASVGPSDPPEIRVDSPTTEGPQSPVLVPIASLAHLSPTRSRAPSPSPTLLQPQRVQMQVDAVGRSRPRPPLLLDAAIVICSLLVAYMFGKRLTTLWDFVTEHV